MSNQADVELSSKIVNTTSINRVPTEKKKINMLRVMLPALFAICTGLIVTSAVISDIAVKDTFDPYSVATDDFNSITCGETICLVQNTVQGVTTATCVSTNGSTDVCTCSDGWVGDDCSFDNYGFLGQLEFDINVVLMVTAIMSMLGSIIVFMGNYSDDRTPFINILLAMSVNDICFGAKFMLSAGMTLAGDQSINNFHLLNERNDVTGMCVLSSWLGQQFGLSSISYNFVIATYLFILVSDPMHFNKERQAKFAFWSHIGVHGLSLLTCIIAYSANAMVYSDDGTCWLYSHYVLLFYAPLFIYVFWAIFVTAYVLLKSRKMKMDQLVFRMVSFTMIFITVWFWGAVMRMGVLAWVWEAGPPLWLVFAQVFFLGSGGFFNFCIWILPNFYKNKKKKERGSRSTRTGTRTSRFRSKKGRSGGTSESDESVGTPVGRMLPSPKYDSV